MKLEDWFNIKAEAECDSLLIYENTKQFSRKKDEKGYTLLMNIATNPNVNIDCVWWLAQYEAEMKAENMFGRTSLMEAVSNGQRVEVVQMLAQYEICLTDKEGVTALMLAALHKRDDLIPLLSKELRMKKCDGSTALTHALSEVCYYPTITANTISEETDRMENCVKLLIDEADICNKNGQSPLEIAKILQRKRCVDVIEKQLKQSKLAPKIKVKYTGEFCDEIKACVVENSKNITFKNVAGLESAKQALLEAVVFPKLMPLVYQGIETWKSVLLYGVPGTGKTYLAQALAGECNCTFISVSASDLLSKWIGESERLIKALFQYARSQDNSIIFIDEIDSLCSSRSEISEHSQRVLSQILLEMQGVNKQNENLFIIGATNFPEKIDPAIRRRLEKRIEVPLPDSQARKQILKSNLAKVVNNVQEEQLDQIAEMTNGYSASDISVLMKGVLLMPVREVQQAKWFKCQDAQIQVAKENEFGAFKMNLHDIGSFGKYGSLGKYVVAPQITIEHILQATKNFKKTVGQEDIDRISAFTKQYGE